MTSVLTKFKNPPKLFKARLAAPPAKKPLSSDGFRPTSASTLDLMDPSQMLRKAQENGGRKGLQLASKGLALMGAFSALVGLAGCGAPPAPQAVETVSQVQTPETTSDLAAEQIQEASFSEGRTLLLDRSERVRSGQFNPDPAMASETRGQRQVYEESYIADLLDRDLTQISDGSPAFTATGADETQSSKLYFDADLNPAEWGGGTLKSENFLTRPTRMMGRGSGISDNVTQHQLSCIYNLDEAATIDGVQLEPGMYRLITLEPSSNVATPSMHRGVCPGHRLVQGDSGFSGDYKPVQTSPDGEQLHVNTEDIVQIWTLTEAEATQYAS